MNLRYLLNNGKNSNLGYYLGCYFRYFTPGILSRWRLKYWLAWCQKQSEEEQRYIAERVEYYCKLAQGEACLGADAESIGDHTLSNRKRNKNRGVRYASPYLFDTQEYTRHFKGGLKWNYCFGDVVHVPNEPSIVKSRPLMENNKNSVLLKLDKNRHFVTLKDSTKWEDKEDRAIFRGLLGVKKNSRKPLFERHLTNPMVDIGDVGKSNATPHEWKKPLMTLQEHLRYKFIFALEGNDVASNLKWVMSSNSIAVMPKATCETWFMEGKLLAGEHYIEVAADFSDLNEKLEHYIAQPEECKRIARNANEYVAQFMNKKREKAISIMVLQRYFEATSQI